MTNPSYCIEPSAPSLRINLYPRKLEKQKGHMKHAGIERKPPRSETGHATVMNNKEMSPARQTINSRLRLKCGGTCAETRFLLSAKRTSPFKLAGASVQSTTGSRGVRISGSNAGYTIFRGSVESTGYTLHSPVSPSLPLPCITVCRHISTGTLPHFNETSATATCGT